MSTFSNAEQCEQLVPEQTEGYVRVRAKNREGMIQYFQSRVPSISGSIIEVSLGYRRVHESDSRNEPGQDAADVCYDTRYLVAVVADGVSQSFLGNMAAEHVSNWLLEWLWKRRVKPPLIEDLKESLVVQAALLSQIVNDVQLHGIGVQGIVGSALDKTRRDSGSQAVFTAIVLEFNNMHGYLYQVGDTIAVVHFAGNDKTSFSAYSQGRWSSCSRLGTNSLWLSRNAIDGATGVVLKSDGAEKQWGWLDAKSMSQGAFCEMAHERADYDDVSFVSAFVVDLEKDMDVPATPSKPPAIDGDTKTGTRQRETSSFKPAPQLLQPLSTGRQYSDREMIAPQIIPSDGPMISPLAPEFSSKLKLFTLGCGFGIAIGMLLFGWLSVYGHLGWPRHHRLIPPAISRQLHWDSANDLPSVNTKQVFKFEKQGNISKEPIASNGGHALIPLKLAEPQSLSESAPEMLVAPRRRDQFALLYKKQLTDKISAEQIADSVALGITIATDIQLSYIQFNVEGLTSPIRIDVSPHKYTYARLINSLPRGINTHVTPTISDRRGRPRKGKPFRVEPGKFYEIQIIRAGE